MPDAYTGPDGVEVWEPWVPLIGQEVRLRLSECPLRGVLGMWQDDAGGVDHSACHKGKYEQRRGLVLGDSYKGPKGHRFIVAIFGPKTGAQVATGHYAACELEPLSYEATVFDGRIINTN